MFTILVIIKKISNRYYDEEKSVKIIFNESWIIGGSNKYFESLIQVAIKENHEVEYIINNENSLVTESLKIK